MNGRRGTYITLLSYLSEAVTEHVGIVAVVRVLEVQTGLRWVAL